VISETIFFAADDGTYGNELWKTDGTYTGTMMVKDVNPTGSSNPSWFTVVSGTVFFAAADGVHGDELWKSDGTITGTVMITDINPSGDSRPGWLINVDGMLYFSARDSTYGDELWKSDGTAAGTVLVKDINLSGGSDLSRFMAVGKTIFFPADDGVHGRELWKSDGTDSGTVLVKDVYPGPTTGLLYDFTFTEVDGTLYFSGDDDTSLGQQLWQSDGTAEGTVRLTNIDQGWAGGWRIIKMNNTLFFNGGDASGGSELWALPLTDLALTKTVDNPKPAPGQLITYTITVNNISPSQATNALISNQRWARQC